MRDLLVMALVLISLPLAFWRPFWGLLTYTWLAYMRPQDLAWTVGDDRFSLWVAGAMLLGLVLWVGRERLVTFEPQTVLLLLYFLWISFTVYNALLPEMSEFAYSAFWKVALVSVLTTGLVRTQERWRMLLLVTGFSLGVLGLKYGIHGVIRQGARFNHGPGGFMRDNNDFALAMNMALPLLVAIALTERSRGVRIAAWVMAGFTLLTVIFTFSRGGLLTMAVVGLLVVARSRQKVLAAALLGFAALGFFFFSSETFRADYTARTQTINEYEEDGSAMGRLNAWKTSWLVFLDYPVAGVGPSNLSLVYQRYAPGDGPVRVSHNTYLQLLSESGLPALALFLALIGATLIRLQKLAARGPDWTRVHARMLQISIVAFMVGSTFLNRAFFDLIYHLVALSVCLGLAATAPATATAAPASVPREPVVPWWRTAPSQAVRTSPASPGSPSWAGRG
ncbi:MAG TPA: putative O-glycosylation ligase, exosortase A system-associated [Thermoanaerobaculia bacterium]|nr:putative O-glycosylation ligase, exosortase A system-associated [Thermoanaerobaculia bacterium]